MKPETLIELFGYLGSALVLISFLLTSVFKLRIVNTIGSLIFAVYALIIRSYPTAVMNLCLVAINLYYLWKMSHSEKVYDFTEVKVDDSYLRYMLEKYGEDIVKLFPRVDLYNPDINSVFIFSHEGKPVGITMGIDDGDNLNLLVDYTIPQYRDYTVGKFQFEKLKQLGYKKITYTGPTVNHEAYLKATGFTEKDGVYFKEL